MDILGPPVLLVEGIGRIGCFMLHEHLGKITGFILGLKVLGESRHDLGLYFSLAGFAGLLFVLVFEKIWKKKVMGIIGAISLFWYFSWRFMLEFFLENSGPLAVTKIYNLTFMQIFSAVMLVIIGYYFVRSAVSRRL
jgi:prolipoprotein diacylglyceryltransferase